MKKINEVITDYPKYPTKVIQFGEGNFLRAFIDWQVQQMNKKDLFKGGVAIVQPIERGLVDMLAEQDNLYTVYLEGLLNGKKVQEKEVITAINSTVNPYKNYEDYLALADIDTAEVIVSNTTESGIAFDETDKLADAPQKSYPGKLTALLYRRFKLGKKGFQIIPCELINHNGDTLKEIVLKYAKLWNLEAGFTKWIEEENNFYSTLVDRIVPGYPRDRAEQLCEEFGYKDNLIVNAEAFLLFVIEGSQKLKEVMPLTEAGLNVVITDDMQPYRERKVRLLNAPHSTMAPIGRLAGVTTVGDIMKDKDFAPFIKDEMYKEISPMIDLPAAELAEYAEAIKERFNNPFVVHELKSIALNSVSKYTTRILPLVKKHIAKGDVPKRMALALAAVLVTYGNFDGIDVEPVDMPEVIAKFKEFAKSADYVTTALADADSWGEDLTQYTDFAAEVRKDVEVILSKGARYAVQQINSNK